MPTRIRRHAPLLGCVSLIVLGHVLVGDRYGVHRDEMYFVACGRQLAGGYVDHPPLVPTLARAACSLGGCGVHSLRFPSLVARMGTVAVAVALVRALGGGAFAATVAGLAIVFAPAYLRMGKILCIPVFEPVFWTAGALLLVVLAHGGPRWCWLVLGLVVGIGTLNKHTMGLWAIGAAIGCVVVSDLRSQLRTRWPWLGVLIAALAILPNLLWQRDNHYATLEFLRTIRTGMLAEIPRILFAAGQLLYMHPFAVLLWMPGLWLCLARPAEQRVLRAFGIIFVVAFGVFLLTRAKPYYLAAAYPPLFAVGAIGWERRLKRSSSRGTFVGAQVATGAAMAILTLPVLPLPQRTRRWARCWAASWLRSRSRMTSTTSMAGKSSPDRSRRPGGVSRRRSRRERRSSPATTAKPPRSVTTVRRSACREHLAVT